MKTITQTAEDLGVSRKKIYNEIEKLNIQTIKDGKNNFLNDTDYIRIKEQIEEQQQCTKERIKNVLERDRDMIGNNVSDREYTDLKEQINFLKKQLDEKDEQLKAKDYQINGLIQSNFNFSKALNPPETSISEVDNSRSGFFKNLFKSTKK